MAPECGPAKTDALASVVVPLGQSFQTADGESTTLATERGDGRALLLDIFTSWSGPCMQAMPELGTRAVSLAPRGVITVVINVDDTPGKAREVREKFSLALPWLMDDKDEHSLAELLHVTSIPRAVLISPDGKVLYNGHPAAPGLAVVLDKF